MEKSGLFVVALLVLALFVPATHAGTVPIDTNFLADLVGDNPTPASDHIVTPISSGNMIVEVFSRAYTGDDGGYAYLYQIDNTGVSGNSSIEVLTLSPFTDADDDTEMGYLIDLTGTVSGDFIDTGGQEPRASAFVDMLSSATELSFYFLKPDNMQIPPGEHSRVLYVMSELAPDVIVGNVINGSVGTGSVVGPVPEPATWIAMLGGLLGLFLVRPMRRR